MPSGVGGAAGRGGPKGVNTANTTGRHELTVAKKFVSNELKKFSLTFENGYKHNLLKPSETGTMRINTLPIPFDILNDERRLIDMGNQQYKTLPQIQQDNQKLDSLKTKGYIDENDKFTDQGLKFLLDPKSRPVKTGVYKALQNKDIKDLTDIASGHIKFFSKSSLIWINL